MESGRHLRQCIVYIDMNMVRTGVVTHPAGWEFGGCQEIETLKQRYSLIDRKRLYWRSTKIFNKNVHIISLGFAIILFCFSGLQQYLTMYYSKLGIVYVGFYVLIIAYLFMGISSFFAPIIVSKFGSKYCMVGASICYTIYALSINIHNLPFLYFMSMISGTAGGILWNAQGNYILLAAPLNKETSTTGYFGSIIALGRTIGVFILGGLIVTCSYEKAFVFFTAFSILGTICFLFLDQLNVTENSVGNLLQLKNITRSKLSWKISIICLYCHLIYGSIFGCIPIFIKDNLGENFVHLFVSSIYIIILIVSFPMGILADKFGKKNILICTLFFSIMSLMFLNISHEKYAIITGIFGLSTCYAIIKPFIAALPRDITHSANYRYVISIFWISQTFGTLVSLVLPLIISIKTFFATLLVISLIVAFFMNTIFKNRFEKIRSKITCEFA